MSSALHPAFHYDANESEVTKLRRALQNALGQSAALQRVLESREPKYVPIRVANGRTQVWIQRLKQWVPILDGDGEATTKDIHDAIRKWHSACLAEIETRGEACVRLSNRAEAAERKLATARESLENIKRHLEVVAGDSLPKRGPTWLIADNALAQIEQPQADTCPKGGQHDYGIDGAHTNEFCKKCFQDKLHA